MRALFYIDVLRAGGKRAVVRLYVSVALCYIQFPHIRRHASLPCKPSVVQRRAPRNRSRLPADGAARGRCVWRKRRTLEHPPALRTTCAPKNAVPTRNHLSVRRFHGKIVLSQRVHWDCRALLPYHIHMHKRPERFRHGHAAIFILVVFQNGGHGAAHSHAAAI